METKVCGACLEVKQVSDFYSREKARMKPQYRCKACMNAYKRRWYTANPVHHKSVSNAAKRRRIEGNAARVRAYLIEHPCVDCGESDPVVLEFDHVRGEKSASISYLLRAASWPAIVDEIAKCDVRCANCHRRRTAKQFGWYEYFLRV